VSDAHRCVPGRTGGLDHVRLCQRIVRVSRHRSSQLQRATSEAAGLLRGVRNCGQGQRRRVVSGGGSWRDVRIVPADDLRGPAAESPVHVRRNKIRVRTAAEVSASLRWSTPDRWTDHHRDRAITLLRDRLAAMD
jgi:hypothetical protein